jgi:hypothetical protein
MIAPPRSLTERLLRCPCRRILAGTFSRRATELTTRALRLTTTADELTACARLARDSALE